MKEAISNDTPLRQGVPMTLLQRQYEALRRYQERDECLPHEEPCTGDPITCGCWQAMLLECCDG